jgi:hypothetical protein
MLKAIIVATIAVVLSVFAAGAVVHGQTTSPSNYTINTTMTPTPSPTSSVTVPSGAPATGRGQ